MILLAAVFAATLSASPQEAIRAKESEAVDALDSFDISRAQMLFEQVESQSRELRWEEGEARGIFGQARVAYRMARHDETAELAEKAAAIAARIGNADLEAEALTQIGLVEVIYRHNPDAIEILERAVGRLREENETASYVHSQLGFILACYGRTDEAESHLEPALRLAPPSGARRVSAYWFASRLRRMQGRIDEALAFAREGVRAGSDYPLRLWDVKAAMGEMLLECGNPAEAAESLREAVEILETRRKLAPSPATDVRHFSSRIWVYQRLMTALLALNESEEALEVAERMRARVLGDSLNAHNEKPPLNDAEREQQRALNQRIVDLNRVLITSTGDQRDSKRELRDARAALDAFTQEMAIRYPRAVAAHAEARTFALKENRGRPAVIEYSLQPDCIVVFVVHHGTVDMRKLPAFSTDLQRTSARLLRRIANRDERYTEDARALYDALLAPVEELVRGERMVSIIPDGFLWTVPFDALITPSGKFVAERHAIAYAPSIAMLDWAAKREPVASARHELLAFGDPIISAKTSRKAAVYRDLSLGALPDAVREVRTLTQLYGSDRTAVFTGAAAREAVLKKLIGGYRVIHLATHGIVDDSSPLYSALVLSAAEVDAEDGLLEMREMRGLDLHADLIVLSGCDTARGDVHQGEGVIGMSWAFLMAGCPTTVVSQWKAQSHTTARLMIEFHKRLLAGDSKAEALRRARLALLRDPHYAHPFYWAPFVVVGEGSSGIR
jgi:CHAT domain-containing protein